LIYTMPTGITTRIDEHRAISYGASSSISDECNITNDVDCNTTRERCRWNSTDSHTCSKRVSSRDEPPTLGDLSSRVVYKDYTIGVRCSRLRIGSHDCIHALIYTMPAGITQPINEHRARSDVASCRINDECNTSNDGGLNVTR